MGVRYDSEEQRFVFDFEHDGLGGIVSLTGDGYQVEAFGHCFYYGYEFGDDVKEKSLPSIHDGVPTVRHRDRQRTLSAHPPTECTCHRRCHHERLHPWRGAAHTAHP